MRKILNLVLTVLIFWVGTTYFNQYVTIDTTQTLIIASLLMFVLSIITIIIVIPFFIAAANKSTTGILISVFVILPMLILITPVKLYILSTYLQGFSIHGFWTYVILTVVFGMFTISNSESKTASK